MVMRRVAVLSALIAVIALSALYAGARPGGNYKVGAKIADFVFKSDQGKTVRLSDYKGKIVVLNFFATW
jgi:cytochrome oxidase Cu insertion factor (SCO1/SenC/PrrC family)